MGEAGREALKPREKEGDKSLKETTGLKLSLSEAGGWGDALLRLAPILCSSETGEPDPN